jgi:hypothetical protein
MSDYEISAVEYEKFLDKMVEEKRIVSWSKDGGTYSLNMIPECPVGYIRLSDLGVRAGTGFIGGGPLSAEDLFAQTTRHTV